MRGIFGRLGESVHAIDMIDVVEAPFPGRPALAFRPLKQTAVQFAPGSQS
jgi:hypothetical protein